MVEGTPLYSANYNGGNNTPQENNYQHAVQGNPQYQYPNNQNQPQRIINQPQQAVQQVAQPQSPMVRLIHVVDKNEKLTTIAEAYKVSVVDIIKWNKLESNEVYTGMKLTIYVSM